MDFQAFVDNIERIGMVVAVEIAAVMKKYADRMTEET